MKSWKTTSGGIAQILAAACAIFNKFKSTGLLTIDGVDMALILGGLGLIFARDNNVSSEQAGADTTKPKDN